MKISVVVHRAEEGGYWAEVPALPGCFTQADSLSELATRAHEVVVAHLDLSKPELASVTLSLR